MMRIAIAALVCCLLMGIVNPVGARESRKRDYRIRQDWSRDEFAAEDLPDLDYLVPEVFTSSTVDTYTIVYYDFEQMNWQGWTREDMTAQIDTFWHVEDYLEPELAGLPGPLEGLKSAWCGAPPGPYEYMCGWDAAPGYGNSWDESFVTDPIYFDGLLRFSYRGYFDSEPDHDKTYIEYDSGNGNWVVIAEYDGIVDTAAVHELFLSQAATKLRIHFISDGSWSDEDGLWVSDGAVHVDSLLIEDAMGLIDYEDFEAAADGARRSGIWHADVPMPFGSYAYLWNNLADEDPCNDNYATQIIFFDPDPWIPPPGPGLPWTPFCKGSGRIEAPCQSDLVCSPVIDMTMYSSDGDEQQDTPIPPGDLPNLGGALLHFTVYRDLPVSNLVGYEWWIRNIDVETGCPGPWLSRNFAYFGASKDYHFQVEEFGDLVTSDYIQVGLYVHDYCDEWYEVYGDCAEHTPSPWFDNVFVQRYTTVGPQWSWRDLDIFQDNFPGEEFNIESYVRADAANDLRPTNDPVIDPGDSIVVTCTSSLGGGIDTTADGWPKVYMHVHVDYIDDPYSYPPPKPDLFGPSLEGSYGRYVSDDGEWTVLQCYYAGHGCCVSPDIYAVDLNDSLFTRGYQIIYYFKAYDFAGQSSTLPAKAEEVPWPPDDNWRWNLARRMDPYYFEWTCLPTLYMEILYVDDFHGRGTAAGIAEHYWRDALRTVLWPGCDRYDVNSPSSRVSNGPGSRAKNYHMTTAYRGVIWDSGNLSTCTISEGTQYSDKSNDAQLLIDWMEFSPHDVGLWVCGDDVAEDLDGAASAGALQLMTTYCGVHHLNDSYFEMTGGVVSPLVKAAAVTGNPLWHTTWGDSFYVFGGCPIINSFDVLDKYSGAGYALEYPEVGGQPYYAGIYNTGINDGGYDIRTMWFGFSFMYIRDVERTPVMARYLVCRDMMMWFEQAVGEAVEVEALPSVNSLAQNFPNPFNPTTSIRFSVKEKGRVTLRVYDVAGRLVRTLVDEMRDAGSYREVWDGTNNRGSGVASGIYFYRVEAPGFTRARKMALLR